MVQLIVSCGNGVALISLNGVLDQALVKPLVVKLDEAVDLLEKKTGPEEPALGLLSPASP